MSSRERDKDRSGKSRTDRERSRSPREKSKDKSKKSRKSKFDLGSPESAPPKPKSSLFTDEPPEGFIPNANARF